MTSDDDLLALCEWDDDYSRGYDQGCIDTHNVRDALTSLVVAEERRKLRRWQLRLRWRRTSDQRDPDVARFDDDRLFRREPHAHTGRAAALGLRRAVRPIHGPKGRLP